MRKKEKLICAIIELLKEAAPGMLELIYYILRK